MVSFHPSDPAFAGPPPLEGEASQNAKLKFENVSPAGIEKQENIC
jgi:hypothetical protein